MTYATEFTDFDAATLPAIPSGWGDISWRNDTCPSFAFGSLAIFVDHADPALREVPETERFSVRQLEVHLDLFASDDWQAILDYVASVSTPAGKIARAFADNLKAELSPEQWDDMCAENVRHVGTNICASHDYCDANMPMAEAFAEVMGRSILPDDDSGMTQEDADLWSEAWNIAKAKYLSPQVVA